MRNPTALGSLNPTQQKTGSGAIEKPCAYWPSKSSMRIQKPFRMISLRKIRQQLPWIDILTKNTGGWGYIPFSTPQFQHDVCSRCGTKRPSATPSAFLHKQLDVNNNNRRETNLPPARIIQCGWPSGTAAGQTRRVGWCRSAKLLAVWRLACENQLFLDHSGAHLMVRRKESCGKMPEPCLRL